MAKIFVRFGHEVLTNGTQTGAVSGTRKEMDVISSYAAAIVTALTNAGHTVKSFKPYNKEYTTSSAGLKAGTKAASDWGAEVFISCHANTGGGTGTEVLYNNANSKTLATQVSSKVATSLGLKDRGAKVRSDLHDTTALTIPSILIEAIFIDSSTDCTQFDKTSKSSIGTAVVEGLKAANIK